MDLHAPLGKVPSPRRRPIAAIASVVLGFAVAIGMGAFLYRADPHGGQPYAVANIPPELPPKAAAPDPSGAPDRTPTGSIGKDRAMLGTRVENGVKVTSLAPENEPRAEIRESSGPMVIDVSKALDAEARKRPGLDKSKEANVSTNKTAKGTAAALPGTPHPRIALFVSGMGLGEKSLRTATEIMPAPVALAFLPYGDTLATSVANARAKGHEILLQLPMQNPKSASLGPHTLSTDVPAARANEDLDWLMGRFGGYVGVTNLLGAPVTGNSDAMRRVLKAVQQRRVFFVDDGTSKHSLAPSIAPELGMKAMQADVVLDATGDSSAVRANLDKLVAIARHKGMAIGVASALSDHLATVAQFAAELSSRGMTLVPISELSRDDASVATAK